MGVLQGSKSSKLGIDSQEWKLSMLHLKDLSLVSFYIHCGLLKAIETAILATAIEQAIIPTLVEERKRSPRN